MDAAISTAYFAAGRTVDGSGKKSMRIWILTSEVPQDIAGGIARYVENFAWLLGTAGHEVVIIARTRRQCDGMGLGR